MMSLSPHEDYPLVPTEVSAVTVLQSYTEGVPAPNAGHPLSVVYMTGL